MSEDFPRTLFWLRLSKIYNYRARNKQEIGEFPVDGVTKPFDMTSANLGIDAHGETYVLDRLKEIEKEGYIELLSDQKYRLTDKGIDYCIFPKTKS
ncbi:MAG: hypothetical protein WBZ36_25875 [Candidatus Nitrosopolaris sp.]